MKRGVPSRLPKGVVLHKATGRFYGRVIVERPDGTKSRVSTAYFASPTEASDALRRVRVRAATLNPDKITLSTFLAEWLAHIAPYTDGRENKAPRVRPATYANRLQVLAPLLPPELATGRLASHAAFESFRAMRAQEFDSRVLVQLLERLEKNGVGSRSTQLTYEYLRAAWRFGIGREYLVASESPFLSIRRPVHKAAEREALTEAEMGRLQEACFNASTPRTRALLSLLVTSGLRVSEALGLQWDQVDLDRGELRVRKQLGEDGTLMPLKTPESSREVLPVKAVMEDLRTLYASRTSAWVFQTAQGKPLDRNNVRTKMLHPALVRAKLVGRVTVHDLRSVAATLAADGLTEIELCQMFGWSNLATAKKFYVKPTDSRREAGRAAAMKGMERAARAARLGAAG